MEEERGRYFLRKGFMWSEGIGKEYTTQMQSDLMGRGDHDLRRRYYVELSKGILFFENIRMRYYFVVNFLYDFQTFQTMCVLYF